MNFPTERCKNANLVSSFFSHSNCLSGGLAALPPCRLAGPCRALQYLSFCKLESRGLARCGLTMAAMLKVKFLVCGVDPERCSFWEVRFLFQILLSSLSQSKDCAKRLGWTWYVWHYPIIPFCMKCLILACLSQNKVANCWSNSKATSVAKSLPNPVDVSLRQPLELDFRIIATRYRFMGQNLLTSRDITRGDIFLGSWCGYPSIPQPWAPINVAFWWKIGWQNMRIHLCIWGYLNFHKGRPINFIVYSNRHLNVQLVCLVWTIY